MSSLPYPPRVREQCITAYLAGKDPYTISQQLGGKPADSTIEWWVRDAGLWRGYYPANNGNEVHDEVLGTLTKLSLKLEARGLGRGEILAALASIVDSMVAREMYKYPV